MANFSSKNHKTTTLETATNAAKILFLIIGIASTAFLVTRFALPCLQTLLSFSLTKTFSLAASWLSPPYLFITVHFIIMVIWKLHRNQNPQDVAIDHNSLVTDDSSPLPDSAITESVKNDDGIFIEYSQESESSTSRIVDKEPLAEQLPWPPPEPEPEPEPQVLNEIHEDSLDATWQAIMDSKSTPPKNQLNKSYTWEKTKANKTALARTGAVDVQKHKNPDTCRQKRDFQATVIEKREMGKSKTFRESTTTTATAAVATGGWRGRDVLVVGRDELFGRVEAFLKMNYEQMRLQRQESEQRFVEMVNATAY